MLFVTESRISNRDSIMIAGTVPPRLWPIIIGWLASVSCQAPARRASGAQGRRRSPATVPERPVARAGQEVAVPVTWPPGKKNGAFPVLCLSLVEHELVQ